MEASDTYTQITRLLWAAGRMTPHQVAAATGVDGAWNYLRRLDWAGVVRRIDEGEVAFYELTQPDTDAPPHVEYVPPSREQVMDVLRNADAPMSCNEINEAVRADASGQLTSIYKSGDVERLGEGGPHDPYRYVIRSGGQADDLGAVLRYIDAYRRAQDGRGAEYAERGEHWRAAECYTSAQTLATLAGYLRSGAHLGD